MVLNYCSGLMCSRTMAIYPNLCRALTTFFRQEKPDFKFTTIQLNKNYAAKMHVDGNNHGPSYIIGLGEYTGGEVWVMDEENGEVEMELPCGLRGYPHLKAGQMVKGILHDCRNKWFKFNGTVP